MYQNQYIKNIGDAAQTFFNQSDNFIKKLHDSETNNQKKETKQKGDSENLRMARTNTPGVRER